jgi:hypothetical protein
MKNSAFSEYQKKDEKIGIIGLGYVELPLAIRFSEVGFKVIGFDIDDSKVKMLNKCDSRGGAVSKGACPPGIPLQGSKSNKKLMVILAGFLGVGLGVVFAFVIEFSANSEKEEKGKMTEAKALVLKNIFELMNGRLK